MFGSKSLWAKFWLISTLCFVLCLANPILEEDSEVSIFFYDDLSLVMYKARGIDYKTVRTYRISICLHMFSSQ